MNAKEKKEKAQDLIMQHLSIIGYGSNFEEYYNSFDSKDEAYDILIKQMDRVANLFNYNHSWFS